MRASRSAILLSIRHQRSEPFLPTRRERLFAHREQAEPWRNPSARDL
jgi:hypothetical protein